MSEASSGRHRPDATTRAGGRSLAVNALSFDVEDWNQLIGRWLTGSLPPCSGGVESLTYELLEVLERRGVKATFFVLGYVAEAFPGLVRDIERQGHEVGSHGWSHQAIFRQTPDEFRRETHRSKCLLEDLIGRSVNGYRAAAFSVTAASVWALDILAELGFNYDSSIFPFRGARYGIPDAPLAPYRVSTAGGGAITEVPLSVCEYTAAAAGPSAAGATFGCCRMR